MSEFLNNECSMREHMNVFVMFITRVGHTELTATEEFRHLQQAVKLAKRPNAYCRLQQSRSGFALDYPEKMEIAEV